MPSVRVQPLSSVSVPPPHKCLYDTFSHTTIRVSERHASWSRFSHYVPVSLILKACLGSASFTSSPSSQVQVPVRTPNSIPPHSSVSFLATEATTRAIILRTKIFLRWIWRMPTRRSGPLHWPQGNRNLVSTSGTSVLRNRSNSHDRIAHVNCNSWSAECASGANIYMHGLCNRSKLHQTNLYTPTFGSNPYVRAKDINH